MTTRPITEKEYKKLQTLIATGFEYLENGKLKKFRPNKQLLLAITLESNLGLRISDVEKLTNNNFKNGCLEITEKKTGKLQYRELNSQIYNIVKDYVIENGLKPNEPLIKVKTRAIQKQLKIVTEYMGLDNISTHSFRKFFATNQYNMSDNNIELVKELLNHSSIATTQKYIRVNQQAINNASKNYFVG